MQVHTRVAASRYCSVARHHAVSKEPDADNQVGNFELIARLVFIALPKIRKVLCMCIDRQSMPDNSIGPLHAVRR